MLKPGTRVRWLFGIGTVLAVEDGWAWIRTQWGGFVTAPTEQLRFADADAVMDAQIDARAASLAYDPSLTVPLVSGCGVADLVSGEAVDA